MAAGSDVPAVLGDADDADVREISPHQPTVWELSTSVNNAYPRVDDGNRWKLDYELSRPG